MNPCGLFKQSGPSCLIMQTLLSVLDGCLVGVHFNNLYLPPSYIQPLISSFRRKCIKGTVSSNLTIKRVISICCIIAV